MGVQLGSSIRFLLFVPALLLCLATAKPAEAQCTQASEASAVRKSVRRATSCNYKKLRSGPDRTCPESPTPTCAGSLIEDAVALAYGENNPPAAGIDWKALRHQRKCQKQIGKAVSSYVSTKLRGLIRGRPPEEVEAKARRQLDRVPEDCAVTVAQDISAVVLPAVGPQCGTAVGDPGNAMDPTQLRDCLGTLLKVWVDRFGPDPQPLRPNIVFILTDDQRWDTTDPTHSPFGTPVMPNLDTGLGGAGIEFHNAFMTTPVCGPSRASLLTGQYAHTTGVHSNKPPNGGAQDFDDASTMGTWLQAGGYRTGFYGKYMNGYKDLWAEGEMPYVPPGWSEWHVFQQPRFFDYTLIRNGVAHDHEAQDYGSTEEDYSTDVLRDLAVDFINSSVGQGQPFFLYLNTKAPHLPKEPAPRHVGMFDEVAAWRPLSYNEPDVLDKPQWVQDTPQLTPEEQSNLDDIRVNQLEMVQAVDEAIAAIMQVLRDNNIVDDTLVVFFSDNGWMWGEHRMEKKLKPYEEAIRSPMFVYYPRLAPLPRGETRFALNIDLAPMLAELAGAVPTVACDGQSLVRLLDGTAPDWRMDFMTEGWPKSHTWASMREADWKYTEYPNGEAELYDLVTDPLELDNVAGDPANAARIAAMAARLRELRPGWPDDVE
jgi:arylsulfatase A-like enzyme